jgi:tetratricopeptide (TPR) repeat protein
MPSHTFTRLGRWEASVDANGRSAEAALRTASFGEALHASDYLEYAYLQMRRDSAAKAVVDGLPAIAARFDPAAVTGAAPGSAGVFALAAIPARYALERRAWPEAAALVPRSTAFPYADAMSWFARGLGAAHVGQLPEAHAAVDSLAAIQARLLAAGEAYWAEQVAIERLGAQAWLELAEGRRADALARMGEAAAHEDATEKNAVTPGPLAPARELLGDLLMELGRPADALAEYRRTLEKEPRRFRSLDGAMRAAAAAGDAAAAARYRAELAELVGPGRR